MTTTTIIIIAITCLIIGWICGFEYATYQWLNCGYKNMIMRIKKKYCFEVKYLGKNTEETK